MSLQNKSIKEIAEIYISAETDRIKKENVGATAAQLAEKIPAPQPAASAEAIQDLEKYLACPLPDSYKEFLSAFNGIKRFEGAHFLLGTQVADWDWAKQQITTITEFWDDYEADKNLALAIAEGGIGISNIWTFDLTSDGPDYKVIDWDNGDKYEIHVDFRSFLISVTDGVLSDD